MGYRLHVQKKHVIEYDNYGAFNYSSEDVNQLLSTFCPSYWGNDEEYGYFSSCVEVNRSDLKKLIEMLQDPIQRQNSFEEADYTLPDNISNITELVEKLSHLLNGSDPENDVIYLDWF